MFGGSHQDKSFILKTGKSTGSTGDGDLGGQFQVLSLKQAAHLSLDSSLRSGFSKGTTQLKTLGVELQHYSEDLGAKAPKSHCVHGFH